ncbi:gag-proteinase polyprotein [Cucumis melo var. makuwa]|uniref:Gag-proteinase polyprotein n=1 Tax=Cucumis melo var. makuwa TaxID=1194695 RepID=A0A5A7U3C4_CUCMM|nr:gag-proteinase polyprotein [Cucumis melo var. makuwa]TYJ97992.1 gag-proteinase polyprotein [Cucumis melo var. makuwa]
MECQHEGCATNRPPLLDGTNYGYWKARMMAFLKSLDLNCWRVVTPDGNNLRRPVKMEGRPTVFKLINTRTSAKEAWDILEVTYEGTSKVKTSRLQILHLKLIKE